MAIDFRQSFQPEQVVYQGAGTAALTVDVSTPVVLCDDTTNTPITVTLPALGPAIPIGFTVHVVDVDNASSNSITITAAVGDGFTAAPPVFVNPIVANGGSVTLVVTDNTAGAGFWTPIAQVS